MTIKDGGQAFPAGNPTHGGHEGMTLRDWFAGQALAGLISVDGLDAETASWQAYQYADAMLRARQVKP